MAVRGINPFEKHVEKIFLALAAAGLTGVVAWQVAGGSGTVNVNKEQVPLDQAYDRIATKAKQLQGQMREGDPRTPEALNRKVDLLGEFRGRLEGNVAPARELEYRPVGLPADFLKSNATGIAQSGQYRLPALPAAAKPIAHPFMSTVSDGDAAAIENLAKFLPAKAPFDKAAVSVETTIDPKAIRAAFESDPDGAGPAQPLLRNWWAGTEVVGVELVREELKPDGTWGNQAATPVLPGRKDFSTELHDGALTSQGLAQIAFDAAASAEEILTPKWYNRAELAGRIVGDEWQSPASAAKNQGAGSGNQPVDKLKKQRTDRQQRLDRLEHALAAAKAAPVPKAPSGGGGGGRGPKGGGAGGGGGGVGTPAPGPDGREQHIKKLEQDIEVEKKAIADLDAQIAALGGKVEANAPKAANRDSDLSMLLSATEPVTIWHHDVNAVRGATYRYQVRVKLNNPVYNRASQLQKDAADAAKSPTIDVPAADWTDPVRVDDEVYCFFTNANPPAAGVAGGTGLGSAQATLFYFTWGYWRAANISLEPGDGMVARWTVPDEAKVAAAPAGGSPSASPPPPAPAGGGKGRAVGGSGAGGVAAPPPTTPNQPALAAGTPLPTKDVVKERDAFLLDVMLDPMTKSNSYFVLVRDVDKSIVAINPAEHKTSDVFARLTASVTAGRQQLQGAGEKSGPTGNQPAPPVPPPGPGMNPGRGSGGFGGG